ncbi:MAG: tRNA pseudouridine(38-40) synthase TruA [Bacteroidaceae bacterium]|nr:tRNA pseudouridine(38-40) synthase TruA [Bacteroidaceae bacterium]
MSQRYFITFAYDGTAYHGWQIQPHSVTVQEVLNRALETLLRVPIQTTGAGRTDTGVHAAKMVAHFDVDLIIDCDALVSRLNRLLPPDICVFGIKAMHSSAHARFDATSRTYHYLITTQKSPFQRHFAVMVPHQLDFDLMNQAARELYNISDFTSFAKLHADSKTNICSVTHAQWVQIAHDTWRFEITADRFLRNMVRAIVGTLLLVGRGKITIEQFKEIILKKDRCAAADSADGKALTLVNVTYPYDIE